jgi:hypothetical protein
MIEPASVICDAPARAMPKSVTFSRSPIRMLCGLMSRWMIPCRCAKRSASRISWVYASACAIGSGPRVMMSSLRLRPSITSIAM